VPDVPSWGKHKPRGPALSGHGSNACDRRWVSPPMEAPPSSVHSISFY